MQTPYLLIDLLKEKKKTSLAYKCACLRLNNKKEYDKNDENEGGLVGGVTRVMGWAMEGEETGEKEEEGVERRRRRKKEEKKEGGEERRRRRCNHYRTDK